MARETATSLDVARLAGVSQSAVSRVFTPGASVSSKMEQKVQLAAQQLGYRPNILARSLITGRSKIIGLVVAYFENQFYPEAVEKLSKALQAEGYHVLIFMATLTADNVDQLLGELLDYQVDGIVMASVSMSSELTTRCHSEGVPVVLFNRSQDDERLSAVTSENFTGGQLVAEFLVAGGHQRIGYIAGWEGASTQRDREKGFLQGLKKAGVSLAAREVGNFHFDLTQEAARRMFSKEIKPDAVFVANDHMAMAVMETIRSEFNLKVPEDVSVVGYDDVGLASWPSFSLTTVRQPSNQMVEATVRTLLMHIEAGEISPCRVAIEGPLIIRKSARIPEGWPQ